MKNIIINPVNNEYESTKHKPTTSDLMKEIGRPDAAAAIDIVTKKITGFNNKTVGALDVASAECRDILSEQLMYKWDSSSGKFFNGNGKSVDTMAEANKLNDETAIVAPGNEGKKFQEQYKKDNSQPTKISKLKSDSDVLIEYYKSGTPQERAQYLKHKRDSKELDRRLDIEMGNKTAPAKPKLENINKNFTLHLDNIDKINEIRQRSAIAERKLNTLLTKKSDPDLKYGLGYLMGMVDD